MSNPHLQVPRNWTFETEECALGFEQHVREQLPWYDLATDALTHIARHYIGDGGLVYDIGCATGNIGQALEPTLTARQANLISIDPSVAMQKQWSGPGQFICSKAEDIEYESFDLAVLFLTLMFVAPAKRRLFMTSLLDQCKPGGALVVFDKLEPAQGYLSTVMYRLTLAGKRAAGVKADEIIDKELSLSGVQRPITLEQLPAAPHQWFKFGDFAGWVIEKGALC